MSNLTNHPELNEDLVFSKFSAFMHEREGVSLIKICYEIFCDTQAQKLAIKKLQEKVHIQSEKLYDLAQYKSKQATIEKLEARNLKAIYY